MGLWEESFHQLYQGLYQKYPAFQYGKSNSRLCRLLQNHNGHSVGLFTFDFDDANVSRFLYDDLNNKSDDFLYCIILGFFEKNNISWNAFTGLKVKIHLVVRIHVHINGQGRLIENKQTINILVNILLLFDL